MSFSFQPNLRDLSIYRKNASSFLLWGSALFVLGLLAISFSYFTTMLSVIILGCIIFATGIIIIFDTFTSWRDKKHGFLLNLIIAILYLVVGSMLIYGPVLAAASLTLLLGGLYMVLGLFRIFYSMSVRLPQWGWSLFNGIVSLVLGFLILAHWPASSLFIIGLFVGIDLVFCGWAYIMIGLAARKFQKA